MSAPRATVVRLSAGLVLAAAAGLATGAGCVAGRPAGAPPEPEPRLAPGPGLDGVVPAGGAARFRFAAAPERPVQLAVDVDRDAAALSLRVRGPDGGDLPGPAAVDDWADGRRTFTVPRAGDQHVAVTAPAGSPATSFHLRLVPVDPTERAARQAAERAFAAAAAADRRPPAAGEDDGERRRRVGAGFAAAADAFAALGDAGAAADAAFEAGRAALADRDYARAVAWLERARDHAAAHGDPVGEADCLGTLAVALGRGLEHRDEALAAVDRAIELLGAAGGHRHDLAVNELNRGNLLLALGRMHEALASYESAFERAGDDAAVAARALAGQGVVHRNLGDFERADADYRHAEAVAAAQGELPRSQELSLRLNRAILDRLRGQPQAALTALHDLLDRARAAGEPEIEATALTNLGFLHSDLGETDAALDDHRQAIALAQARGWAQTASWNQVAIGWIWQSQGQTTRALDAFAGALAHPIAANVRAYALHGLGLCHLQLDRLEEAADELVAAQAAHRQNGSLSGQIDSGRALAEVYLRRGEPQRAAAAAAEALRLARQSEDPERVASALALRAELERAAGDLDAARASLVDALAAREEVRARLLDPQLRTSFVARWGELYEADVDLLMELDRKRPGQGWAAAAFEVVERSRARTLVELLGEARVDLTADLQPALAARQRDAEAALSAVQQQLMGEAALGDRRDAARLESLLAERDRRRRALRAVETAERAAVPGPRDLVRPEPLSVAEVQRLLGPDTALLEYALGEQRSFLFLVTPGAFHTYELPAAPELRRWIADARPADRPADALGREQAARASNQLYRVLVAPAAAELAGVARLLVVPHKDLLYLPFELLRTTPPWAARGGAADYLLARWTVAYVPSATVLAQLPAARPPDPAGKRLVAFANPRLAAAGGDAAERRDGAAAASSWNFRDLAWAEDEVHRIAAPYPSDGVAVFTGPAARESVVKHDPLVATARVLHFATHGRPGLDSAEISLLLAPDPPAEDGLLQMHEIFRLHLAADLAVLSACDTGLGVDVPTEGLVGLTRAFFYAGVPSVVASLWAVDDRSTAELMVAFYRRLDRGEDKATALRDAKLELLDRGRYGDPYYWAPFVLFGRPR